MTTKDTNLGTKRLPDKIMSIVFRYPNASPIQYSDRIAMIQDFQQVPATINMAIQTSLKIYTRYRYIGSIDRWNYRYVGDLESLPFLLQLSKTLGSSNDTPLGI